MRGLDRFHRGGRRAGRVVGWILVFALLAVPLPAAEPVSFTTDYGNLSGSDTGDAAACGTSYDIRGRAPSGQGSYPVFVYLMGTFENFPTPAAEAALEEMARRGFVAVDLDYPNASFGECSTLKRRSECAFSLDESPSAIGAVCSRPEADCAKGVVAAGFSQGSILSLLARDYDTRVRAVYGMGAGVQYAGFDLRSCVAADTPALPSDRLRVVNGESDEFLGPATSSVRSQTEEITGLTCGDGDTAVDCFRSNGSGWDLVLDGEVADTTADHCYPYDGDLMDCTFAAIEPNWRGGADSWALEPNLDWLVRTLEEDLVDDRFEPNDGFDSATVLANGVFDHLMALDEDVYAVPLRQGDTLSAVIRFSNADANLDLTLHDPGRAPVDASTSTTADSETVGETHAAAGTYFVRVERPDGDTSTYSLTLASTNASGGSGGGGGGGCLIERLGPSAPMLGRLRGLRDSLMNVGLGRGLTHVYYRFFGGEPRPDRPNRSAASFP